MTRFRPCIDLHEGKVKQIVGGTLRDDGAGLIENFVSEKPADYFASMFADDHLLGGHVIQLGGGNQIAARAALAAYPGGLQIGGGINLDNASEWLDAGASHVIVTSWLFDSQGQFQLDRLQQLVSRIGKDRIVVDLSCRRTRSGWQVAMNRWQTLTNLELNAQTLGSIAEYTDEFLIHAADVEGKCEGIDRELVQMLGDWGKIPITYAGGVGSFADIRLIDSLSNGKVDVTVGSALDIFGGSKVAYRDLVEWNRRELGIRN